MVCIKCILRLLLEAAVVALQLQGQMMYVVGASKMVLKLVPAVLMGQEVQLLDMVVVREVRTQSDGCMIRFL